MCFVFLFTEALITCPSTSVSLCCYIAPDRAKDFVLTEVLQLKSVSQLKFLPVHIYSYCCKVIPEMFNATRLVSVISLRRTPQLQIPLCNYVFLFLLVLLFVISIWQHLYIMHKFWKV